MIPEDLKETLINECDIDVSEKKTLGSGSFGTVETIRYKNELCVIKQQIRDRNNDCFIKEARFLSQVTHFLIISTRKPFLIKIVVKNV